jgi:hypothetical protein
LAVDGAPEIDQLDAGREGDCVPNVLPKLIVRVADIHDAARLCEIVVIPPMQGAAVRLDDCRESELNSVMPSSPRPNLRLVAVSVFVSTVEWKASEDN